VVDGRYEEERLGVEEEWGATPVSSLFFVFVFLFLVYE
jgi:hypothetical protein